MSSTGILAGTTTPAAMFQRTSDGWEQVGDDLTGSDGSVLDVVSYDGGTFAGVTTHMAEETGTGQVFALDGDGWTKVGDGLNHEVTSLEVFEGDLYAVTSGTSGELYRYLADSEWSKVLSKPDWNGFAASQVFDGKLFVGDALHDVFGYFDGDQFVFEADNGGSCVFSFEVHLGQLYAGAYSGLVYARSEGGWPVEVDAGDSSVLELFSHDGLLHLGMSNGDLLRYDDAAGATELVHQFDESVVGITSLDGDLIVGTGANAAQYGSYLRDGSAATYRVLSSGDVESLTDGQNFGGAVQVAADVDAASRSTEQSRSATALTYIPGYDEDKSKGGDRYAAAMPDWVDGYFHGDEHAADFSGEEHSGHLDDDLSDATSQDKDLPEYNEDTYEDDKYGGSDDFPYYRVKNTLSLVVQTSDGETVDSWNKRRAKGESAPITLEGEEGEGNLIRGLDQWYKDHPDISDPWDYQAPSGERLFQERKVTVEGIEGVQLLQAYGGSDIYLDIMQSKLLELDRKEFLDAIREASPGENSVESEIFESAYEPAKVFAHLVDLPKMYTFVELTVMADGSSVTRLWDAGPYPRHALYVGETTADATKVESTDFDVGEEWRPNQNFNKRFFQWSIEAQTHRSPYGPAGPMAYASHVVLNGPLITDIEVGETLTKSEIQESLSLEFPFGPGSA